MSNHTYSRKGIRHMLLDRLNSTNKLITRYSKPDPAHTLYGRNEAFEHSKGVRCGVLFALHLLDFDISEEAIEANTPEFESDPELQEDIPDAQLCRQARVKLRDELKNSYQHTDKPQSQFDLDFHMGRASGILAAMNMLDDIPIPMDRYVSRFVGR